GPGLRRAQGDPRSLSDRRQDSQRSGNGARDDRTDSQGNRTMAVDPVTTAASNPWANAGATTSDANKATLNYDSFLQLLIAQMKNQDPTEPMDAGEQMSQPGSLSQVEQTIQTNAHLGSMLHAEALTRAGDLGGKYVKSADDEVMGMVKEVEVYSAGVIVVTDSGEKVLLQAGVVFSSEPISEETDTPADETPSTDEPDGGTSA